MGGWSSLTVLGLTVLGLADCAGAHCLKPGASLTYMHALTLMDPPLDPPTWRSSHVPPPATPPGPLPPPLSRTLASHLPTGPHLPLARCSPPPPPDLHSVQHLPEWPAANVLLRRLLLQLNGDKGLKHADTNVKNMCIDFMGQVRDATLLLLLFLAWHVHRFHGAEGAVAGMPCHTCVGFMGQLRGTTLLLLLLLAWHVHRLHGAVEGYYAPAATVPGMACA